MPSSSTTRTWVGVIALPSFTIAKFRKGQLKGGPRPVEEVDGPFQLLGQRGDDLQTQRVGGPKVHRAGEADTIVTDGQQELLLRTAVQLNADRALPPAGEGIFEGVGEQFIE